MTYNMLYSNSRKISFFSKTCCRRFGWRHWFCHSGSIQEHIQRCPCTSEEQTSLSAISLNHFRQLWFYWVPLKYFFPISAILDPFRWVKCHQYYYKIISVLRRVKFEGPPSKTEDLFRWFYLCALLSAWQFKSLNL